MPPTNQPKGLTTYKLLTYLPPYTTYYLIPTTYDLQPTTYDTPPHRHTGTPPAHHQHTTHPRPPTLHPRATDPEQGRAHFWHSGALLHPHKKKWPIAHSPPATSTPHPLPTAYCLRPTTCYLRCMTYDLLLPLPTTYSTTTTTKAPQLVVRSHHHDHQHDHSVPPASPKGTESRKIHLWGKSRERHGWPPHPLSRCSSNTMAFLGGTFCFPSLWAERNLHSATGPAFSLYTA